MAKYKENSLPAIFQNQVIRYGNRPCVAHKKEGKYVDVSWNEMNRMIRSLGKYLISIGIRKGDKVAIFSPNRYEWWVADQAILSIGAVNIPIYATNSAEEAFYILNHSDSKACFVAGDSFLEKVNQLRKKLRKLKGEKSLISFEGASSRKTGVTSMGDALKAGDAYRKKDSFDKRLDDIKPRDLATIIYTSGTTGDPKGVMLSHYNIMTNADQALHDFLQYISEEDVLLSFLPLSHSLERTAGYYMPLKFGAKVAFAEDFSTIQQNLNEIRPTILISVPRLYEKIHAGILAKVAEASPLRRAMFNWTVKVAARNLPYVCENKQRSGLFAKQYKIANKLVFSKLKAALGLERMKFAVSGGGPLSVADAEFFLGMGIIILEGFGLTETSPITNVNRVGEIKPGSVGRPVKDTVIKLSDEGEILVKGPQVMQGYYKDRRATKAVFTKDGFFRTGDIGSIDARGRLSITGRLKDIIVTAGGKNISPQNIENRLKNSPFIEQIAIIGDRRKYLSAVIIPAFDALHKWARDNHIEFIDNRDLISDERVYRFYEREIEDYTRVFSRAEQIRKFVLLDTEWTQETDELTPTLKVKRRVIEEKYRKEIESMYESD